MPSYSRIITSILAVVFHVNLLPFKDMWFYVPLNTKYVISDMFPKPISWLGMEKLNLTQQKQILTNQKQ